jgi:hypothetical protein
MRQPVYVELGKEIRLWHQLKFTGNVNRLEIEPAGEQERRRRQMDDQTTQCEFMEVMSFVSGISTQIHCNGESRSALWVWTRLSALI